MATARDDRSKVVLTGQIGVGAPRMTLQSRDYKLNLKQDVGKKRAITEETATFEKGGFFCALCDRGYTDSESYMVHINGPLHQSRLGFSMRVEAASLEKVRARIRMCKKARFGLTAEEEAEEAAYQLKLKGTEKEKHSDKDDDNADKDDDDEDEDEEDKDEDEGDEKKEEEEEEEEDEKSKEIAQMMGFAKFKSARKWQ